MVMLIFQDKSPQHSLCHALQRVSETSGENNFRFDTRKLLLDDDADLALVQHVVEGSSLPLLVPVVHLPHATGNQPQGESNEDLLHHTRALEGGMCNPATCHLLAVEVRCQMPEKKMEIEFTWEQQADSISSPR